MKKDNIGRVPAMHSIETQQLLAETGVIGFPKYLPITALLSVNNGHIWLYTGLVGLGYLIKRRV